MELTPFVERLRSDLSEAAAAGGPEAQAAADRLALALDPATRMMLLEALSQAASEITGALDNDAVDVRMSGREPEFVVTRLEGDSPSVPPAPPAAAAAEPQDDSQSRITLRLPESVKARAEEAANEIGQSLNSWLVDAVRDALGRSNRFELEVGSNRISVTGDGGRRKQVRGWVR